MSGTKITMTSQMIDTDINVSISVTGDSLRPTLDAFHKLAQPVTQPLQPMTPIEKLTHAYRTGNPPRKGEADHLVDALPPLPTKPGARNR